MTNNKKTTARYRLESDAFFPDDETMREEELTRLLEELAAGRESYARGEVPVRMTQLRDGVFQTSWQFHDGSTLDHYRVLIEWNDKEATFIASLPELPDCRAAGPTQEQALRALRLAADAWIETAIQAGQKIPHPRTEKVAA